MVVSKKLSDYWWSQNKSITKSSPWLLCTLAELDEKTKVMLNLIDQEADSYEKWIKMYYRQRPELIKTLGDLYRSHLALAVQYDRVTKFEFDLSNRLLTRPQTSHDSSPESIDLFHDQDSHVSEIDDHQNLDKESLSESNSEELMSLRDEIERLKEENKIQKNMLVEKDEEKREAKRQLSLYVDSIKQENLNLKKRFAEYGSKMQNNTSGIFSRVFWEKDVLRLDLCFFCG